MIKVYTRIFALIQQRGTKIIGTVRNKKKLVTNYD